MGIKDQTAVQIAGAATNRPQMRVTPEIVRNSKTAVCDCGGMIFQEKIFIKIFSPLISPSGKEEMAPMPIFVCEKCGKVPSIFDENNILPDEIKAKKL
jgi:hypothetical protein